MLDCAVIESLSKRYEVCEQTADGLRLPTQCMYPSFEPVEVFVLRHGDGYIVHDNANAGRLAWTYGIDDRAFAVPVKKAASEFGCDVELGKIICKIESFDWLWSAIIGVANASSDAARAAVGNARAPKEVGIIQRARAVVDKSVAGVETRLQYPLHGASGKVHKFDMAVLGKGSIAVVEAVVAHPGSVAAKYLALSDTPSQPNLHKFAIYDSDLTQEDKALISNVADLVTLDAVLRTQGHALMS